MLENRHIGRSLSVAFAILSVSGILWVISAFLPVLRAPTEAISAEPTEGFSLLSPEFLLRLNLFPEAPRTREIIGVIVENQQVARQFHTGLEKALLVEEFLVEGMISRFLVVYDRNDLPEMVGPVRSLRPYFVDGALPWVSSILHAGGSPEAFERAAASSDLLAINALHLENSKHFQRDTEIPAPHNLFLPTAGLDALLPPALPSTLWPPYPTGRSVATASGAHNVMIDFYSRQHNIQYSLMQDGRYRRVNGELESAMAPRNVAILEMPITDIGELGRLSIDTTGKGAMLLFHSGTVRAGTWKKAAYDQPFEFWDLDGVPLRFVAGQTWITVVPSLERVMWK